ncbi:MULTISPECIES: helix-turn-helix domain-containing protein [Flavobacterium]|uniref:helix-turn-helix domain-containing protein n=1 Tax=Flavobacterium TaxID=237 RepID=UPI000DAD7B2B|nr:MULTISPECIES: helix-turn-helix transcriptional regulator [Flavobacterium]KAF2078759.1 helix-turn-helix transcriptional regulator [Flavobacterium sharifuzzamanii]WDF66616.1 helix-turn-helix transcriptional regulator [Flavobacterium sp. KACC 22763]
MMYHEKLSKFFRDKGLKQKEVGAILGFSPAMIGRYLHGTASIGSEFILSLSKNFPDVDLNDLFADEQNKVNEAGPVYEKQNILNDLQEIEGRIHNIRLRLADKKFEE